MEVCIVDWRPELECFDVVVMGQPINYFQTAREAVEYARANGRVVTVADGIDPQKLVELSAAAIFAGIQLLNRHGRIVADPEPVPVRSRYITRAELGNLLPDGWYIEVQHGRYAACFGEQNQLPFRGKLTQAVTDIRIFLAAATKQTAEDLHNSLAARPSVEELEQLSF